MSNIFENFRIALSSLNSNKLRAALTMIGITIGVMAVIVLVSVGQAVEDFIVGQFEDIGSNLIVLTGKESMTVDNGFEANDAERFEPLTDSDIEAISDPSRVPALLYVAPMLAFETEVVWEDRDYDTFVAGTTPEYFQVIDRTVIAGRGLTDADIDGSTRVALVGSTVIENLFSDTSPLGETVRVNGVNFEVIGVLDELTGGAGDDPNDAIFVPLTTAQRRLDAERTVTGDYPVTLAFMQARNQDAIEPAVSQVAEVMREEHDIEPGEDDDFQIFSQLEIVESLSTITGLLTLFLAAIAGISLVVGGIGIMNIMTVTVQERTREIGLRKAVGAQNGDILLQFLVESVTLATLGGLIGTVVAIIMTIAATALIADLTVTVQVSSVLIATAISVAIGAFFGALPAHRASRLNPIDALHYE